MPVVDIKGVGKAQFPDEMPIDDIKAFLQQRFAREATNPIGVPERPNVVAPRERTLVEKIGQGIGTALEDTGLISNRGGAQEIGRNVAAIGEFLPGIGDATAGDDFGRAVREGDVAGMALGSLAAFPVVGKLAKKLKPHQVSPTSKEWSDFDFDEINREAFGVTESDVTKLNPSELNIKWTDDLDNVEHEIKNSGKTRKEWAKEVDLSTPIDVILEDGVYKIDDGHHRYSAAKILGKDLPVSLQINDQPFVGLAKRATERGEEVHPAIMKAAVDRGFKPADVSAALKPDEVLLANKGESVNRYGDNIKTFGINKDASEVGNIEYIDAGDSVTIIRTDVDDSHSGKGIGTRAYKQFVDKALSEGKTIKSDAIVSPQAQRVYEKLKEQGYNVVEAENLRNVRKGKTTVTRDGLTKQRDEAPTITLEDGTRTAGAYRVKGKPVFEIKPK